MGNTHLGSCALPSGEVSSEGRRVEEIKDSASQPPAVHGDLTHHTRIFLFTQSMVPMSGRGVPFFSPLGL